METGTAPHPTNGVHVSSIEELSSRLDKVSAIVEPLSNGKGGSKLEGYEQQIKRVRRWGGSIASIVAIGGTLISLGVAWAVFVGENATDSEVTTELNKSLVEHNGGVAPSQLDPDTLAPVGHHPDMRKAIQANTEAIQALIYNQKRLLLHSAYQFEWSRWQAAVAEKAREGEPLPDKPQSLDDLEAKIFRGDYD